jgi:glycerophosphoryl diester phosphodiesterase
MMVSWETFAGRPVIVAHRGASRAAPENTLAAFGQALREGAQAIELDVHLTRDGEVVVIHDHRLERTTDGRGRVSGHTLRELKRLSAGSWFHRRYSSERIPTLEEVLELAGERACVNIEIKAAPGGEYPDRIVERCLELARLHAAENRILISSFHTGYLRTAHRLRPAVQTGLLYHPVHHRRERPVELASNLGARCLIVSGVLLRKRLVLEAHANGLRVGEYTVNSRFRISRALRFGVDLVMTDDPGRTLRILLPRQTRKSPRVHQGA